MCGARVQGAGCHLRCHTVFVGAKLPCFVMFISVFRVWLGFGVVPRVVIDPTYSARFPCQTDCKLVFIVALSECALGKLVYPHICWLSCVQCLRQCCCLCHCMSASPTQQAHTGACTPRHAHEHSNTDHTTEISPRRIIFYLGWFFPGCFLVFFFVSCLSSCLVL